MKKIISFISILLFTLLFIFGIKNKEYQEVRFYTSVMCLSCMGIE